MKFRIFSVICVAVLLPAALSINNIERKKELFEKSEVEYRVGMDTLNNKLRTIRSEMDNKDDAFAEFDELDLTKTNHDIDPWARNYQADFISRIANFIKDFIVWTKFDNSK